MTIERARFSTVRALVLFQSKQQGIELARIGNESIWQGKHAFFLADGCCLGRVPVSGATRGTALFDGVTRFLGRAVRPNYGADGARSRARIVNISAATRSVRRKNGAFYDQISASNNSCFQIR
jgi:hypothetical protein